MPEYSFNEPKKTLVVNGKPISENEFNRIMNQWHNDTVGELVKNWDKSPKLASPYDFLMQEVKK